MNTTTINDVNGVRELSVVEIDEVAGGPLPLALGIAIISAVGGGVAAGIGVIGHLSSDDCTTTTTTTTGDDGSTITTTEEVCT